MKIEGKFTNGGQITAYGNEKTSAQLLAELSQRNRDLRRELNHFAALNPGHENFRTIAGIIKSSNQLLKEDYKSIDKVHIRIGEILNEYNRACSLHPDYPEDMFHQLAVMQEEAGEVAKAVVYYHAGESDIHDVREELIQTAAMCLRMLMNLNQTS